MSALKSVDVLGTPICAVSWNDCERLLATWLRGGAGKAVYACNVHSVMTARNDWELRQAFQGGDLLVPDGAPVAWYVGRETGGVQERIDGPSLMWRACDLASRCEAPVFLYGGSAYVLQLLVSRLTENFPTIRIVGAVSPPYRELTADEEADFASEIRSSGAKLVLVCLGCPKQEKWIARNRSSTDAIFIGVGAAFEFFAGTKPRAPMWMREVGLEWLHRLYSEPRRLWRRYLFTNTSFVLAVLAALISRSRRRAR